MVWTIVDLPIRLSQQATPEGESRPLELDECSNATLDAFNDKVDDAEECCWSKVVLVEECASEPCLYWELKECPSSIATSDRRRQRLR